MSRIILIQDDDYERQYLESKNYLNSKFHDHPTRLKNIPSEEGTRDEHGRVRPSRPYVRIGKLVI